ncbi:glycosyltransferase family 4 protein [Candidatus Peregrinibacteria bacterium]|nr:glycosyltransferase family 4 protein [Candidatus Peregrinibacteria bacterium]
MATIGIDCRMYSSRFTGIGRYVYELTSNLFKIDDQNHYVLFFNDPEYSEFTPPNDRVTKVRANARHYSLSEQIKLLFLLRKYKLDLMHFTHFNAPILFRHPSIVTIHDLTLSFYPGKKMTSGLFRHAYKKTISSAVKNAKKVIAVSQNTKKDIQEILHTDPSKIEVIYEGVNANFRPIEDETYKMKLKEKLGISGPFLLYTGVWRTHKNLQNLIRAFSILKKEYGYDGNLVITGKHDPTYAKEIFRLTSELALTQDIIFTGMVEELELIALYSAAQVYVFPSLYEGFGLPPLEAMQCGTPVATSSASCMPEICGEDNALFFDPQSPQDMAEKIFRLASEHTLPEKLIENGFQRVKQFSWETMAKETLALYNECLN